MKGILETTVGTAVVEAKDMAVEERGRRQGRSEAQYPIDGGASSVPYGVFY